MSFASSILIFIATVLSIACGALYIFLKRQYSYWEKRGVHHTKPKWLVGDIGSLGKKSMAEVFLDIYNANKDHKYFGFWISYKPTLMINDPELIKHVLVQDFSYFQDRGGYFNEKDDPLSANLVSMKGHKWKNMRAKLSPTFTSGKMKGMFPMVLEVSEDLIKLLDPIAKKGGVIEVKDVIARFGTDVIASCAFGIQANTLQNPNSEFRTMGRKVFEPTASVLFKNATGFFLPEIARLLKLVVTPKDVTDFFLGAVKDTMEYREKHGVKRNDLMETMIQLKNQGYVEDVDRTPETTNDPVTFKQAAAEAFIFYVAGFETSSSTLQFTIYELARNPDIQERLRQEIQDKLKETDGEMTFENIHSLKYLGMVLDETLRLYSPGAFINRECSKDYKLPGTNLTIEKGTQISIPAAGLHSDPRYYSEPAKFDPQRFTADAKAARNAYVYLPFGEGPRFCIGKRFAIMQMRVAMVSILSRYRLELCAESPKEMKFDPKSIITSPAGGMHIKITTL